MCELLPQELAEIVLCNLLDGEGDSGGANFSAARNLRLFPDGAAFALRAFGPFGLRLLALNDAAALVYPTGVLSIASCGAELFVLRLDGSELCVERVGGGFRVVFADDVHPLATDAPASRLSVAKANGQYRIECAVGRQRFRVHGAKVTVSSVLPKLRGRRIRSLQTLGCPHKPNNGKNILVPTFPAGEASYPYFVFAEDQTRGKVKAKVYASETVVTIDYTDLWRRAFYPFNLDGSPLPQMMWNCQSHCWRPHSRCRRSFLFIDLGSDVGRYGGSENWRVIRGARLYNFVFMTIALGSETVSGVVCLPPSGFFMHVQRVVPYDRGHVMLLCSVTCCGADPDARPEKKQWTVLCRLQPLARGLTFPKLEGLCVGPEPLEETLHALMLRCGYSATPILTVPGHFRGHVATASGSATMFGGSLLTSGNGEA